MIKQKTSIQKNDAAGTAVSDWRWQAVLAKKREFDGAFFFAVKTTGIFCRPSCASKSPKRENVLFFLSAREAERAGFRACRRCEPEKKYAPGAGAGLILRAFGHLQSADADDFPTLEELSVRLGVSAAHLQKTFKTILGLSPKEIMDMRRLENFKKIVRKTDVVTALYESGFGSSRALYEKAGENLGMTPAVYKKGGKNMKINYAIVDTELGKLLVAATARGICAVSFGDERGELESELKREFGAAKIEKDEGFLKEIVTAILSYLEGEKNLPDFPLDVRASAFQMRVWAELRRIPYGETRSYGNIAEMLGNPKAFRAVARACATNPIALLTPCHRVIAASGELSGYRWGIERKRRLLAREKEKNG